MFLNTCITTRFKFEIFKDLRDLGPNSLYQSGMQQKFHLQSKKNFLKNTNIVALLYTIFQSEDPELLIRNQSSMHSNTKIYQKPEAILASSSKYLSSSYSPVFWLQHSTALSDQEHIHSLSKLSLYFSPPS